jgi:alkaline phosphatase D
LQAARARWPFICIWDDHEFSNDCWQSEANYIDIGNNSSTDEPSQQRKVAANQAWFEYTPANLTKPETMDEDLVHMKPFESVSVSNTPNDTMDDNNLSSNEDNLSAIGSMTIYRSLRFGQFVNLLLTDNRSYRSDHAIPESISGNSSFFLHPRVASPLNILNQLDAGKTANEGSPNSHIYTGEVIPNPRLNSPPGTVLGSPQKHWWKEILRRSDTDWNIWANSIPLTRLLLNLSAADGTLPDAVLSSDTWDGYCTERNELMAYLLNNGIDNLVSFSGDLHAHIAGLVMHDYEVFHNSDTTDQAIPVLAEMVCAGISSRSQFSAVEELVRFDNPGSLEQTLRNLVTYDAAQTTQPSEDPLVNNLNNTLLNGARSGLIASITNSREDIGNYREPLVNGHVKFIDSGANGYGLALASESEISVQLVTVSEVITDPTQATPQIAYTANFSITNTSAGNGVRIDGPMIQGTPPFPFV